MGLTVNIIPPITLPFVLPNGIINPIWYEFFRKFIAATVEAVEGEDPTATSVTAGAGLTGGGAINEDITLTVGQGAGILVEADDVSVDIDGQTSVQAALDDEILLSDVSDNGLLKKTAVRNIVDLSSPGGNSSTIQYNNAGAFAGDSSFTTNGSGSVDITGDLDVDNININGNTLATNSSANPFIFTVPAGALNQFTFTQSGAGASACELSITGLSASTNLYIKSDSNSSSSTANAALVFNTNAADAWAMGLNDSDSDNFVFATTSGLNVNQVYKIETTGRAFAHLTAMRRMTTAGITASTTQSQGQGALTADVNEVSTCANANDTVTLPGAEAGRHCLVINNGAETLQVFPASGDNLGAGVDTSTTITAGSRKVFIAFDSTNWEPVI